jgi:hypothetical protein
MRRGELSAVDFIIAEAHVCIETQRWGEGRKKRVKRNTHQEKALQRRARLDGLGAARSPLRPLPLANLNVLANLRVRR